jgi:ankyrin repeat protein
MDDEDFVKRKHERFVDLARLGDVLNMRSYLERTGADAIDIHYAEDAALVAAAADGKDEAVKILIAHGADINAQAGEALCRAARLGYTSTVKILLDAGANQSLSNFFAVRAADAGSHKETVSLLFAHLLEPESEEAKKAAARANGYVASLKQRYKL